MNLEQAKAKLAKYNQEHLLKYYDELNAEQKQDLLDQVESTDFSVIGQKTFEAKVTEITPIKVLTLNEIAKEEKEDKEYGLECLRTNKVALLLVAGGMGTRLGSSNPKGMYNVGLTRELYIFECQINNILDVVKEAGVYPYLFIMTSPKNDVATRNFFMEKNYFGYDASKVHFFIQNMAPIVDMNGKVLLEEKGQIALSPNGNGGWFTSFVNSGLMEIVKKEGIEYFNLYAVDNVLQRIADPVFIGATLKGKYSCGAKVIKKANPYEGLGVMCLANNRPAIVEYYELTDDMRFAKDEQGEYIYYYGVIMNYLFSVNNLLRIMNESLPLHKAFKKCAYIDEEGNKVTPTEPNAYKYEALAVDLVKLMDSCLPYEVVRNKEFAPIKNLTGVDSVESARELLKENGVKL